MASTTMTRGHRGRRSFRSILAISLVFTFVYITTSILWFKNFGIAILKDTSHAKFPREGWMPEWPDPNLRHNASGAAHHKVRSRNGISDSISHNDSQVDQLSRRGNTHSSALIKTGHENEETIIQPNNNDDLNYKRSATKSAVKSSSRTIATQSNSNRLYCMVPFIWTPSAFPAYHAIRATWGKRCHILKFFIDPIVGNKELGFYKMTKASDAIAAMQVNLTLPSDVVILHDMQRPWHSCTGEDNETSNKPVGTCRNIWEKIWRAWVNVVYGPIGGFSRGSREVDKETSDAYKAEWFVKVDADTFLFPENVRRYVESKNWSYNDHHYFGHVLNHRVGDRGVSIVAGAAVFLSRATLLAAADVFRRMPMENGDQEEDGTCRDAYTGTEEVVTAVCLKKYANITADEALDSEGREQVSLYDIADILTWNRTEQGEWWYWEGKKRYDCHDNGDCLSHLPIAFHGYKDSQFFHDFEKEFYENITNTSDEDATLLQGEGAPGVSREWDSLTRQYIEKIRLTMNAAATKEESDFVLITESENKQLSNALPQSTSQRKNRLYCMVPFIWTPSYLPAYYAIHSTWGKRCDVLKFMIDPIIGDDEIGYTDLSKNSTYTELPEDVVVILDMHRPWNACPESTDGNCRNIWEKIWRSWVWVDSHGDSNSAEWFVKVDADTFLFPENLKRYVAHKNWSPNENHYFGHILYHRVDDVAPLIAGAAVFFSRTTLKEAAAIFRTFSKNNPGGKLRRGRVSCQDLYTDQEEVITAACLKEHLNVQAEAAHDDTGRELVTVGEIEEVLAWNRTEQGDWWYWKNKPKTHPVMGDEIHQCCGDFPIAFHGYKNVHWLYKLERELYDTMINIPDDIIQKMERSRWRNLLITDQYLDRVRKSMAEANFFDV